MELLQNQPLDLMELNSNYVFLLTKEPNALSLVRSPF